MEFAPKSLLVAVAIGVANVPVASAAIVSQSFSGRLLTSTSEFFNVGDQWSVDFSYDTTADDFDPSMTRGYYAQAISSVDLRLAGERYVGPTYSGLGSLPQIEVVDGGSMFGQTYDSLFATAGFGETVLFAGAYWEISLRQFGPGSALDSAALPPTRWDVSSFEDRYFRLGFYRYGRYYEVTGDVTAPVAVAEPPLGSLVWMFAGLVALLCSHRTRRLER